MHIQADANHAIVRHLAIIYKCEGAFVVLLLGINTYICFRCGIIEWFGSAAETRFVKTTC